MNKSPRPFYRIGTLWISVLIVAFLSSCEDSGSPVKSTLRYVTSVSQVGPVAYRDPLGVLSPDGRWIAYTSDRYVDIIPSSGGPSRRLGPGVSDLRQLVWMGRSDALAVLERSFDRATSIWYRYDTNTGERQTLWRSSSWPGDQPEGLTDLAWQTRYESSADAPISENTSPPMGVAGVIQSSGGTHVILIDTATGSVSDTLASGPRLSFPAWMPDDGVACLSLIGRSQSLQMPCGTKSPEWAQEVYGPVAYSRDGSTLYFATPDESAFVDLWARDLAGGRTRRISSFDRDAYAPSTSADGTLLFKSQDYRVFIAMTDAEGGETIPVTTFQSETPMWDWSGTRISFTWGNWRGQTDDLYYPDISQEIGYLELGDGSVGAGLPAVGGVNAGASIHTGANLPASEPTVIVRQSKSEDQSMHWSPNGRWIVFHTHVNGDDIWLKPADGSRPGWPITHGGSETGWPRWSRDGRWIQYPSFHRLPKGGRRSDLFVLGVDQETGDVTTPAATVDLVDFSYDALQGEWLGGSDEIVFEAAVGPGKKRLYRVPRAGGRPTVIHSFSSPQVYSGISASPDGRWIVYVAPGRDGWLQIFRVSTSGGTGEAITFDPSNKTQPAYSPDGKRVAFTVFSYQAHFWAVDG